MRFERKICRGRRGADDCLMGGGVLRWVDLCFLWGLDFEMRDGDVSAIVGERIEKLGRWRR